MPKGKDKIKKEKKIPSSGAEKPPDPTLSKNLVPMTIQMKRK